MSALDYLPMLSLPAAKEEVSAGRKLQLDLVCEEQPTDPEIWTIHIPTSVITCTRDERDIRKWEMSQDLQASLLETWKEVIDNGKSFTWWRFTAKRVLSALNLTLHGMLRRGEFCEVKTTSHEPDGGQLGFTADDSQLILYHPQQDPSREWFSTPRRDPYRLRVNIDFAPAQVRSLSTSRDEQPTESQVTGKQIPDRVTQSTLGALPILSLKEVEDALSEGRKLITKPRFSYTHWDRKTIGGSGYDVQYWTILYPHTAQLGPRWPVRRGQTETDNDKVYESSEELRIAMIESWKKTLSEYCGLAKLIPGRIPVLHKFESTDLLERLADESATRAATGFISTDNIAAWKAAKKEFYFTAEEDQLLFCCENTNPEPFLLTVKVVFPDPESLITLDD